MSDEWTLSIFIEPTKEIVYVIGVVFIVLSTIGGIIIFLHVKEKEEDRRD